MRDLRGAARLLQLERDHERVLRELSELNVQLEERVRLRTRELGVRMALGAQRSSVMQLVLMQGARLAAIGIICGVLAALALGRIFSSLLFNVGMLSAIPWLTAIVILVAVVLLATFLPARRAASIEPMQALRSE